MRLAEVLAAGEQRKLADKKQAHHTPQANRLLSKWITPTAASIRAEQRMIQSKVITTERVKYAKLLMACNPLEAAAIAIRGCTSAGLRSAGGATVYVSAAINAIGDEIVEHLNPDHLPMTNRSEAKAAIGLLLVVICGDTCKIEGHNAFFSTTRTNARGRKYRQFMMSPKAVDKLAEIRDTLAALAPRLSPMIVPPSQWDTQQRGGYLIQKRTLIKPHNTTHRVLRHSKLVYDAINYIQSTPLRINQEKLEMLSDKWESGGEVEGIPPASDLPMPALPPGHDATCKNKKLAWSGVSDHNRRQYFDTFRARVDENERRHRRRTTLIKAITEARKLSKYERIYYPHHMDYRGRVYPTCSCPSVVSTGYIRDILEFADPCPITGDHSMWSWDCRSSVFQHYAAMCRDERIGAMCGLSTVNQPSFYQQLGQYVGIEDTEFVKSIAIPWAFNHTCRGLFGPLTEMYMAKGMSATDAKAEAGHNMQGYYDNISEFLYPIEQLKQYIIKIAKHWLDKTGLPLGWTSPSGFCVHQHHRKSETKSIEIRGKKVTYGKKDQGPVDKKKQLNSVLANVLHSLDAAHLHMVAYRCGQLGYDLCTVHDMFMFHQGHAMSITEIIRSEFMVVHGAPFATDLATKYWRVKHAIKPPDYGTLDIKESQAWTWMIK